MKKITSLALIIVVMLTMVSVVFAHQGMTDLDGGHFKKLVPAVKELKIEAVEEVIEWSLVEKEDLRIYSQIPNQSDYSIVVDIDKLDYSIEILKGLTKKAEKSGAMEKIEGNKEIEVSWIEGQNKHKKITFTFEVIKTIVTEAQDAVYENVWYVENYHYHSGEYTGQTINFYPEIKIKWEDRIKHKKDNSSMYIPTPTTSSPTTSATITTTPSATTTLDTDVTETNTIVKNNAEKLPKTGENSPINYMIIGAIVLVAGLFLFLRLRLN